MIKQISRCNVVWKALLALADPMTAIRPSKIDTIVVCRNSLGYSLFVDTEPSKDCFSVREQHSNL